MSDNVLYVDDIYRRTKVMRKECADKDYDEDAEIQLSNKLKQLIAEDYYDPDDLLNPVKSRHVEEQLFCGGGERTLKKVRVLHALLNHGIGSLSGQQQPPVWQKEPTQEVLAAEKNTDTQARRACQDVVRDIAMALTGKEIIFVDENLLDEL